MEEDILIIIHQLSCFVGHPVCRCNSKFKYCKIKQAWCLRIEDSRRHLVRDFFLLSILFFTEQNIITIRFLYHYNEDDLILFKFWFLTSFFLSWVRESKEKMLFTASPFFQFLCISMIFESLVEIKNWIQKSSSVCSRRRLYIKQFFWISDFFRVKTSEIQDMIFKRLLLL